jgi:hypothetical protein
VDAGGGTLLPVDFSLFSGASLSGRVLVGGKSYGFYGSVRPATRRENSVVELSAILNEVQAFPFVGGIQFRSFTTVDSAETTERAIAFSFGKDFYLLDRQLSLRSALTLADISGGQSASLPVFQSSIRAQAFDADLVTVTLGASVHAGKNPSGASLLKLYPELQTTVQLDKTHRVEAAYSPRVERGSLEQSLQENPYRQASTEIRHRDYSNAGEVSLESVWNNSLSSKVSANVQAIDDFPLLVDSLSSGWWQNLYAGRVTRTTIRAEMFAKFRSFDYFASSITLDLSKNSTTGEKLPYLPAYEFVAEYFRVISELWNLKTSLTILGAQETLLTPGVQLPGFSRIDATCSYKVNSLLTAQLSVRNLTDSRGERWRGYQEFPLIVLGGVSVNW